MPLLRGIKLRVLDDYVDLHSAPVSAGICNEYQSQSRPPNGFDDSTNPAGYTYQLPDSNYICGLTEVGSVASTIGKVQDFMQTTSCARFGGTPGFLWNSLNNDDLLMPGENGEFSVSFWFLAEEFSSASYDIVGKSIPSASKPRFLLSFLGGSSEVSFTVASSDGSATFEVKCLVVPGRWNLVTARCYGKSRRIDINNSCEDGVFEYSDLATTGEPGCSSPGDPLYVGVNPDGASNPLSNGIFLLQQVCFWDRLITDAEERELYADGRGICRWPDPAVPYQFTGGLNGIYNKYGMTDSISHISPAVPGSGCENEPDCWSMAMTDYSPDSLTVSVSWTASPGGCIPGGSDFVLHRNDSQIIKGYRFGRTFESDLLSLPCGGSVRLFLESVPYHMSKFRYRQYLGVETEFGGTKSISKFAITLGVSIIKNPGEIDAFEFPNSFTSPSPSGANFRFPYSDSFSDYANDIVTAGWTDFATVVLDESITAGNVTIESACIVANKYRFTVGSDNAGLRGGDCGWQMGVSDVYLNNVPGVSPLASADSRYNFRATTLSQAITNNQRVVASDPLLNRPFSAVARGLFATHDEDGKLISAILPFSPDSFTAVIIPSEFVRPEPFSAIRTGGCIDCDVTASFYAEKRNPPLSGNPQALVTSKILKRQSPQKTLSGAVSVVAMGAVTGETDGAGLIRVLGQKPDGTLDPEYVDIIGYIPGGEFYPATPITRHLYSGGTFRPSGEMQFTAIINQRSGSTYSRALADINPESKVNLNREGTHVGSVAGTTLMSVGNVPANDTASDIQNAVIDRGNQEPLSNGDFPTDGIATISVSNCNCASGQKCDIQFTASIDGILWPLPLTEDALSLIRCNPITGGIVPAGTATTIGSGSSTDENCESLILGNPIEPIKHNGVTTVGFIRKQDPLRAGLTISAGPLMVRPQHTYQNPPSTACWGGGGYVSCFGGLVFARSGLFLVPGLGSQACAGQYLVPADIEEMCEFAPVDSGPFAAGESAVKKVEFSLKQASFSNSENGTLRCVLQYQVEYQECQDITSRLDKYWYSDNVNGQNVTMYSSETFINHIPAIAIETREAIFESSIPEDVCLRGSEKNGSPATLFFISDSVVGRTYQVHDRQFEPGMTTQDLERIQFDRHELDFGENIHSGSFQPFNPVVPRPSIEQTWSPGQTHLGLGIHETTLWSCGGDNMQFGDPYRYAEDHILSYSPSIAVNPFDLVIPTVVDFSSATITVQIDDYNTLDAVGFPDSYSTIFPSSSQIPGTHIIEKELVSHLWSESSSTDLLIMSLDVSKGEMTVFAAPPDEERVAARYRLAGFPDSRWSRYDKNQMQLVSADWSIGDWPIYITVEPA